MRWRMPVSDMKRGELLWSEVYDRDVGFKVREYRTVLGLTQEQLALRAGLTSTCIAMIERGEREPSVSTLRKVCKAMDEGT